MAYWFRHDLQRIRERFDVRELKSSKDIADWNAGKIPVAVIHPASAGHGLNLQAGGSTLVWFGLTWSLELYQQITDRRARRQQIELFLAGLKKREPLTVFRDEDWLAMVVYVTVTEASEVTVTFKDGTEIEA